MRQFTCYYNTDKGDTCTMIITAYSARDAAAECRSLTSYYPFKVEEAMT